MTTTTDQHRPSASAPAEEISALVNSSMYIWLALNGRNVPAQHSAKKMPEAIAPVAANRKMLGPVAVGDGELVAVIAFLPFLGEGGMRRRLAHGDTQLYQAPDLADGDGIQ